MLLKRPNKTLNLIKPGNSWIRLLTGASYCAKTYTMKDTINDHLSLHGKCTLVYLFLNFLILSFPFTHYQFHFDRFHRVCSHLTYENVILTHIWLTVVEQFFKFYKGSRSTSTNHKKCNLKWLSLHNQVENKMLLIILEFYYKYPAKHVVLLQFNKTQQCATITIVQIE